MKKMITDLISSKEYSFIVAKANWTDIAFPFEEELEDCVMDIFRECKISGNEVLEGNAIIHKKVKKGYIILTDSGDTMFLPKMNYKGKCNNRGTRIRYGKVTTKGSHSICVDAMECVSFQELKYRMFTTIEDCNMTIAATSAWGIYQGAPEPLHSRMKECMHSLRNAYKSHRDAITKLKTNNIEQYVA